MNVSSASSSVSYAAQAPVQRTSEASEGMRAENDRDTDDGGAKAAAQPFISKPTAPLGNHVNTVA